MTNRPAHELVERGVGYVPQRDNVFPRLTIDENLRMGLYLQPRRFAERRDVVCELFPRLAGPAAPAGGLALGR